MVALMAAVAIMGILSTVGYQVWADIIRRDNEAEMMFRAQEIVRGLRRYNKDKGTLPTQLSQLMERGSRQQFFLRHPYKDPLVKGGKWGLLYFVPGGGVFDPHGDSEGGTDANGNPILAPSNPNPNQNPFGNPAQGLKANPGGPGQTFGGNQVPGFDKSAAGAGEGGFGKEGEGGAQGMPIAGVKSLCTKKPFRVFRDQTEYSKWLFTIYDQDNLGAVPGMPTPGKGVPLPGSGPGLPPQQRPRGFGTNPN